MSRVGYGSYCLCCIAATLGWSATSVAQFKQWGDQVAQDKSLPRTPTAVVGGESDTIAQENYWTVGLATGLPKGTFPRFGAEIARNLHASDELWTLPIVTPGATKNPQLARQEATRATPKDAADQEPLFQRLLEWKKPQKQ